MQYTDLTRKELQREYSRLTRKYTDFIRQPVELDLTTEDPLPGCANRRAVKHFGTVLDKELRDTGVEAAGLTVFLVEEGEERRGLNATDLKDAGVLDGRGPGAGGDGVVIGLGAVVDELVECLSVERGGSLGIIGALGGAGGGTLVGLGAGVGAAGKTKAGDGCEGGGNEAAAVENDLLGEVLAHSRTPFSIKSLAVE